MKNFDEIIIPLINEGKTVKQIVELTGIADCTVRRCAKRNNLTISSRKTKLTNELLDKIKDLIDKGLTNSQIAVELNMSPTTVRKYTKDLLKLDTNSIKTKPLINKEIELTDIQLEILYGSLLGDMYIGYQGNECRFSISQGGEQEVYFDYKCSFFPGLLGKINKSDRYDKRTNKWYHKYSVKSNTHHKFTELHNFMYKNGIKTVTQEWLDKVTPRGLAFWFMDDGTNSGELATNCFSKEECELIKDWFLKTYNIDTTIHYQHKGTDNEQYMIYIKAASRPIFYNLIKDYIIPEMEYKFKNWNK